MKKVSVSGLKCGYWFSALCYFEEISPKEPFYFFDQTG